MISDNLYNEILIEPAKQGCDELKIVSGYATSAMAFNHLNFFREHTLRIDLIIGMCPIDGISLGNHQGFIKLINNDFPGRIACKYRKILPPVHTKLYIWMKEKQPIIAFMGSANYTQTAFNSKRQLEALTTTTGNEALEYFHEMMKNTINCIDKEADQILKIYNVETKKRFNTKDIKTETLASAKRNEIITTGLRSLTVSFLANNGTLPARSGLNWGQRPEERREPNQAYIRLTADIYKTDYFPPVGVYFTVLTDDNDTLICTRAQENGKAIHTPYDNSIIGKYFRKRLGLRSGEFVELKHLKKYGRNGVTFYKIDDETYFMDFSV